MLALANHFRACDWSLLMRTPTDMRIAGIGLAFLPVQTRVPLKFGAEIVTSVACARVCISVMDDKGHHAKGWGETPLGVQWAWPSKIPCETRNQAMQDFCLRLAEAWLEFNVIGHPLEIGFDFAEQILPVLVARFNQQSAK